VPVTAKLSRLFYERLGDQVANELVEWFNVVDAAYRSDLREFNELNFARFDAKLDQRIGELNAKLDQRIGELTARFDAKLDQRIGELSAKIDSGLSSLKAELIKWMFVFWAGTALAGALFR
jgi:hypothetical protein